MAHSDKLAETHDRLIGAIESLISGEEWRRMLDVARQFHSYSFGNLMLIGAQAPNATRVAGFRTWKKLGRSVCKGEHGIAILAPCVYRGRPVEESDDREHPELAKVLRGFRVVHVFDVSQTDGEPLDDVAPVLLEGDAPTVLWDELAKQVAASGFHLVRQNCSPANGSTDFVTRTVVVRPDLSPAQSAKTLVHEIAHTQLHDGITAGGGCRGIAEVEAESVAYIVCSSVGVTTDDYSFPYIARWAGGDASLVRKTAERVIGCARQILSEAGVAANGTGETE